MNNKNRQELIKKLVYQSCNRGCKETDLIIGQFAKANIEKMSDSDLEIFKAILSFPDADIYDWYTKKKEVPIEKSSQIMTQILKFETKPR